MSTYRYPGAQPFTTAEQHIFFGRKADIEALNRQIRLEPLLVLYARSGLGKSSLLNAGLIPTIRQEGKYLPVSIRFNAYNPKEEESSSPLDVTQQAIALATPAATRDSYLEKLLQAEKSLWYQLKDAQARTNNPQPLLLIFDQFEELFTYPEADIKAFKKELAEVLYTKIPQRFRNIVEQEVEQPQHLTSTELALLHQAFAPHVVMAIRSDRISLLDRLADHLPNIKRSWYELDALNIEQAEDAILNPAYMKGAFLSPIFDYDEKALQQILKFLTQNYIQKIESFQLQILCQATERTVIRQGLTSITNSDLGNIESIYENYYSNQIGSISNVEDQLLARRFIEEGLIFEEEERRLSLYEGQVFSQFNLSPELLRQLEDTHLIRREPSLKGGFTYELSHDTLVGPVLRAKQVRQSSERQAAEETERRQREIQLQEAQEKAASERQLREKAQQKELQARQRTRLALFVSFIALLLAIFAGRNYLKAQGSEKIANEKTVEANDLLQVALQEKVKTKEAFDQLILQQDSTKTARETAERNLRKALEEEAKTKKTLAKLILQQDSTKTARLVAEQNLEKALQEEAKTKEILAQLRIEQDSTRAAKDIAEKATQEVSKRLIELQQAYKELKEERRVSASAKQEALKSLALARQDIRHLKYESALLKIKAADALEAAEDSVTWAYLELIFWYNEIGQINRAVGILDSAIMAGKRQESLSPYQLLAEETTSAQAKLREVLKNFDPARYQYLYQRYYPKMILVKGGEFEMGCNEAIDKACREDEDQHKAMLSDFYMAQYETTWWQYYLFCAATGYKFRSPRWEIIGNHPVVNVSWKNALTYSNWVSKQHRLEPSISIPSFGLNINSKGYRLPSETEWEYAAKGGHAQQMYIYSGSNDLESVGWFRNRSKKGTHPVGQLKPNRLRLYDMSGNVSEWCFDNYKPNYLNETPLDYFGPEQETDRISRGGSWKDPNRFCRSSFRYYTSPNRRIPTRGFRVAKSK